MCYKKPGPRCATHSLEAAMRYTGMQRDRSEWGEEALVSLLCSRGGLEALGEKINRMKPSEHRVKNMSAYRSAYAMYQEQMKAIGVEPHPIKNHPDEEELEKVPAHFDRTELSRVAYNLYGYAGSPLHDRAREIDDRQNDRILGYFPGEPHTSRMSTRELAKRMNVDVDRLPDGYVAFDIETDTSRGYGLRPHRTQITELVLSDKNETIVLSGDEKHILQGLADYMNSRTEPITLVGWNNSAFDNSFLHIRAQAHPDLKGWGGDLRLSHQPGGYPAVGGYRHPQAFSWKTPDGVQHGSEDAMLTVINSPKYSERTARLKPLATEHGMNVVELDRDRLHEYSAQEREEYVASDGIATLFNLSHYKE